MAREKENIVSKRMKTGVLATPHCAMRRTNIILYIHGYHNVSWKDIDILQSIKETSSTYLLHWEMHEWRPLVRSGMQRP